MNLGGYCAKTFLSLKLRIFIQQVMYKKSLSLARSFALLISPAQSLSLCIWYLRSDNPLQHHAG